MTITLEPTEKIVKFNDVPSRIWEGTTLDGIPVICFITRIAVALDQPREVHERFAVELREQRTPSAEAESFPLRMIL